MRPASANLRRFGKGALCAPSISPYARRDGLMVDARDRLPFNQRARLAAKRDAVTGRFVAILFCGRGPVAVIRLVAAIVVSTFNGVLWRWAWPHVGKEGQKIGAPAVAHRNTAFAVAVVALVVCVVAPSLDAAPHAVLGGAVMPVSSECRSADIATETPATLRVASANLPRFGDDYSPACAATSPMRAFGGDLDFFNCGEASEGLSGDVHSAHFSREYHEREICR